MTSCELLVHAVDRPTAVVCDDASWTLGDRGTGGILVVDVFQADDWRAQLRAVRRLAEAINGFCKLVARSDKGEVKWPKATRGRPLRN